MKHQSKEKNFISRILVPTDFSDRSAAAFRYAIALAKPLKAHLILVHVIDPTEGLPFTQDRRRLLDDLSKGALKEKIPVEVHLAHGAPLGEILHSAKREKADLIVLGAHERSGADHLSTDCVAEKVVGAAPCPVVTVPSRPAHLKGKLGKADLE